MTRDAHMASFDAVLSRLAPLAEQLAEVHQLELRVLRSELELAQAKDESHVTTDGNILDLTIGPWLTITDLEPPRSILEFDVPLEQRVPIQVASGLSVGASAKRASTIVPTSPQSALKRISSSPQAVGKSTSTKKNAHFKDEDAFGRTVSSSTDNSQTVLALHELSEPASEDREQHTEVKKKNFRMRDWWLQNYHLIHEDMVQIYNDNCAGTPKEFHNGQSLGQSLVDSTSLRFYMNQSEDLEIRASHGQWSRSHTFTTHTAALSSGSSTWSCPRWHNIMLYPDSKFCSVWGVMSLAFLAYDFVMVPIDISFDLEGTLGTSLWNLVACIFWLLDIGFNFITATLIEDDALEIRPLQIALRYAKTWLLPDVFIVGSDVILLIVAGRSDSGFQLRGGSSPFRLLRSTRCLRLLRLLRVLRRGKLIRLLSKLIMRDLLFMTSERLNASSRSLRWCFYLLIFAHLWACLWHLIGMSVNHGWVSAHSFDTMTVHHQYALSLSWVVGRIQGGSNHIHPTSKWETAFDSLTLIISFIFCAFFIGTVTHSCIVCGDSSASRLQKIAENFAKRHRISRRSTHRMRKFLGAHRIEGRGEILEQEERLFQALPFALQEDLQFEARAPVLHLLQVWKDMHHLTPRAVRHLCHETLTNILAVEDENVFAAGDACSQMFFVTSGQFRYRAPENVLVHTPRAVPRNRVDEGIDKVKRGHAISEAALWTQWEHCGELSAVHDSTLLAMDAQKVGNVIAQHKAACVHAVKYAKHFVWRTNQAICSDMMGFDLDMVDIQQELHSGSARDHFIFISHFKHEAGTEATLMRDQLERAIKSDPSDPAGELQSPVFIDSEDLTDLARLISHVESSQALAVLLTPGYLTRPWCLMELVAALRSDVKIVPVEIQRPGWKYAYPDADFYARLHNGDVLDIGALAILEKEGVTMDDVEEAIRQVFLKIALPFSPHKSGNVREAELVDILARCHGAGGRERTRTSCALLTQGSKSVKTASMQLGGSTSQHSTASGSTS